MTRTSTLIGCGSPSGWISWVSRKRSSFGWTSRLDVGDLVEEQRAAGRGPDDARERRVGAGEGPLAVAEQLAFEHVARHGGAVERQERPAGAIRRAVDGARQHFLAGAGFARQEDGERRRGDAARDAEQLGHLLGDPDALGVAVERLGRPQGGALLLLAAIAFERQGGADQLADGDEGAAVVELGARLDDELPGLVAVAAERDGVELVGRARPRPPLRRSVQPRVSMTRGPLGPCRDEGHGLRAAGRVEDRERLAPEDARMACRAR